MTHLNIAHANGTVIFGSTNQAIKNHTKLNWLFTQHSQRAGTTIEQSIAISWPSIVKREKTVGDTIKLFLYQSKFKE